MLDPLSVASATHPVRCPGAVRRSVIAALFALGLLAGALPAQAQADILLQLRSGSPMGDRMRVDSAGGFVFLGTLGIGIIPATGQGERTMWYPFKGAFRSGSAGGSGSTTWDDVNIGFYSWAGGYQSRASAYASFAFGDQVTVTGVDAVGFGASHTVAGSAGFAAGNSHECSAFACVAIGNTNRAAGVGSVALGDRVHASADWAVALGRRAHAKHTGAFAWGDASTTDSLRSTANNQFSTRAAGGYRFFTSAGLTAGVTLSAGGSTWNPVSDVNRKEHFREVDGEDLLQRLRLVPVTTWRYRDEEDRTVRHMGPMAQDWHRVFDFGGDPLRINMGDMDGVNLAAVQALERRTGELRAAVEARDGQIQALEQDRETLRAEIGELRASQEELQARHVELMRRVERLEASRSP
jgi:trimeric autotransporter adhesin